MCGIFGLINHKPRKFDRRAFITLGCANDARGGDACGVFIDGEAEYGTEKDDVYFQNWFEKSKQIYLHNRVKYAIGHCRKASVGGKAADKAQPVVIKDEHGNNVFCLVHNGTIYNYEELAKKYIPEIDIKGMTDSQVMAHIFYYKGYDVLKEYRGGGAFVTVDYRDDSVRMFKGASLDTNYSTATVKEERPLYFAEIADEGIVFSSIFQVLRGLYFDKEVYVVPSNQLLIALNGTLYIEKEYDRSKCYQCKEATVITSTHFYGAGSNKDDSYWWEDWDDTELGGFGGYSQKPDVLFNVKDGYYYTKGTGKRAERIHGAHSLSSYGYKYEGNSYSDYYKKYYFWHGLLLNGKEAFDVIEEYWKRPKVTREEALGLAKILSYNPVCENKKYHSYNEKLQPCACEDYWDFPFTKMIVTISPEGKIIHTTYALYCNAHNIESLGKEKYEEIRDKYVESLQRKHK